MSDAGDAAGPAVGSALPAPLFLWLSPAFPVGAYAYSHGLEAAVAQGAIRSEADLEGWLRVLIGYGSIGNDLVLLAVACRAAGEGDMIRLREAAALGLALQPSAERYLETTQQGASFMAAIRAAWPTEAMEPAYAAALRASRHADEIAYPIAVAIAAAGHAMSLGATLLAYAIAAVANLVSASIRLGVLGQTAGQRLQAGLQTQLAEAALRAECAALDDLSSSAFAADLACLQHETLPTRIFRS